MKNSWIRTCVQTFDWYCWCVLWKVKALQHWIWATCCHASPNLTLFSLPRVFVNRSLAMEKIKCFGFDMDYTLAGKCSLSLVMSALINLSGQTVVTEAPACWLWMSPSVTDTVQGTRRNLMGKWQRIKYGMGPFIYFSALLDSFFFGTHCQSQSHIPHVCPSFLIR